MDKSLFLGPEGSSTKLGAQPNPGPESISGWLIIPVRYVRHSSRPRNALRHTVLKTQTKIVLKLAVLGAPLS